MLFYSRIQLFIFLKRGNVMLEFKIDVLSKLKERGYNTTRLRKEKLIGENALTNIRKGVVPGIKTINSLCELLDLQPGSIIRYIPDENKAE